MFQILFPGHNTVAMELHRGYEPLRWSQKDGLRQPAFDFQPLPTSTLHGTNPQAPSSTTSCAKSEPLPVFAPPLWLLYLCRSLAAETSTYLCLEASSPRQPSGSLLRREAKSLSIPARQQKRRRHFPSVTLRPSRLTPPIFTAFFIW